MVFRSSGCITLIICFVCISNAQGLSTEAEMQYLTRPIWASYDEGAPTGTVTVNAYVYVFGCRIMLSDPGSKNTIHLSILQTSCNFANFATNIFVLTQVVTYYEVS